MVLLGPLLLGVVLRPALPALSPPPLLGGVTFPISFQVVLPSLSSFWWGCLPSPPLGGAAFFHLLKGGAAWFPSSLSGVAFPLSGAAFRPLLCVVVLCPLSSVGSRCLVSLLLGGVAFFSSPFGGLPSSPSCGWSCFFPLFSWVVLLGFFTGRCCFSNLLLCAAAFLLLLWVGTTFPPSSVGWCCLVHPGGVALFFGGAAFLPWVGFLSPLVFLLWVVLPFFLSFWWDYFSPVFSWVVLLGPLLLGVVLRPALSPPPF